MKIRALFLPVMLSSLFAGDFLQESDQDDLYRLQPENVYLFGVYEKSPKKGKIRNLYLLDNANEKNNRLVFAAGSPLVVNMVLFETGYDDKTLKMRFNIREEDEEDEKVTVQDPEYIINNEELKKRKVKDRVILITGEKDNEVLSFWTATRRLENLTRIMIYKRGTMDWYIDLLNNKIVFYDIFLEKHSIKMFDY